MAASQSIDALIDRRGRDGANPAEELWKASERKHRAEIQRENRAAWRTYHLEQAVCLIETALALCEEHRARAKELLCDEPRE